MKKQYYRTALCRAATVHWHFMKKQEENLDEEILKSNYKCTVNAAPLLTFGFQSLIASN